MHPIAHSTAHGPLTALEDLLRARLGPRIPAAVDASLARNPVH
jgi:hypothetical protein